MWFNTLPNTLFIDFFLFSLALSVEFELPTEITLDSVAETNCNDSCFFLNSVIPFVSPLYPSTTNPFNEQISYFSKPSPFAFVFAHWFSGSVFFVHFGRFHNSSFTLPHIWCIFNDALVGTQTIPFHSMFNQFSPLRSGIKKTPNIVDKYEFRRRVRLCDWMWEKNETGSN